ncbi:MAG: antitoxin [Candidatus Micrarchaeota archaeon]|nr:antitoxin [Candidatus Micrarchaeota archaeon]
MVKTITIRTSVYEDLIKVKKKGESFSELFERLLVEVRPIEALARLKGSMEFKNKKKMLSEIYEKRSGWR